MANLPDDLRLKKMDPKVKRKWLKALRSGKYRRAQAQLAKNGRYCCLGVLCEVMRWPYEADEGEPLPQYLSAAGLSEDSMAACVRLNDGTLDDLVNEDLRKAIGKVKGYRKHSGASFRAIADFVEKKL